MTDPLTTREAGAATAPASGARQVWRRLRARPSAVSAAAVLALLILLALAAPLLAALEGQDPDAYHDDLVDSARGGVPLGAFGGVSADHWLGVEPGTGRDLFVRLLYGARVSLAVAVGATAVQVLLGLLLGLAAGLGGRWADSLLTRLGDIFVSLPMLVIAISLTAIAPADFPRPLLIAIVIGLLGWVNVARVVRAQTLALKNLDFVAAARLAGSGPWRVARRELLPSLAAPVITYAALLVPVNMTVEAAMSFLGVGVKPPTPSWGQMLSSATTWFRADPVYVLLPASMLFLTVLAFTVLGDGLRAALDPRAASRLRVGRERAKRKADRAGGASASVSAVSVSAASVSATSAASVATASASAAAPAGAATGSAAGVGKELT
ncbi:ABC transporter permease [Streptomyces sp. LX-29]|uniref:ABC transporter permease n=1 Tax=Streptomyces sp. LX-29 TaxID=2900152 RepID=UPI00240D9A3B|nr:ABC transporter permease [Streptomyces sp. LX-29]WFB07542.1 ABC transporter permease [Streptomyces sp. LX-29]